MAESADFERQCGELDCRWVVRRGQTGDDFLQHFLVFSDQAALWDVIDRWHLSIGAAILESWDVAEEIRNAVLEHRDLERTHRPPADITEIVGAFPRLEMKHKFAETCRHLVTTRPETSYDNFLRDFGERFVPGYRPISTVDLLMNAPFEE